ncbi:MAG TPA: hypothetical protein VMG36_06175 [Thermoplasmata archaeon]|nr:hypothetical protein [Thermoplasmata archaeon]
MSGPGGVGPLPSSRLTRILQEKAEALKKKRQTAEAALKEVEERTGQLDLLGLAVPGVADQLEQIHEFVRRSDWESVETHSQTLLTDLGTTVPPLLQDRRQRSVESLDRLTAVGLVLPASIADELEALAQPAAETPWTETLSRLGAIEAALRESAVTYLAGVRDRAVAVARWAGVGGERLGQFEARLPKIDTAARDDRLSDAIAAVQRALADGLPEAAERRQNTRASAERLRATAEELGAPTVQIDAALKADATAPIDRWPESVPAIDAAITEAAVGLRERCGQALEALRGALATVVEYGVDPSAARVALEAATARLATVTPLEIPPLLAEARAAAEESIVTVVAGLLDEVRPRIAAARRLGRDPSDVFAAMNRAREALRLKIYSEALAAAQEAVDRVSRLTEDLDTARDELQTLEAMLGRFKAVGFPTEPFDAELAKIRGALDRADVAAARKALGEAIRAAGKEALQFFLDRWTALDRAREYARERGFLPPEIAPVLAEARQQLDRGDLAGAAERIGRFEVELRTAAAPFVARRVEGMEKGFSEIADPALTAPVRRLLADADVTLRVKQDVVAALDSLRRAERDFASVFGAHASSLVEGLESEVKVLSAMGGASDEIQRQIDEVQQIFNMGDFVKASRASREIRTRAQQQQLVRADEAISHAKLSLVELEPMGLELGALRPLLDEAQEEARQARYLEAYRVATRLEESAARARSAAQAIVERLGPLQEHLTRLQADGVDPAPFYEPLRQIRTHVQALDFDRARGLLEETEQKLGSAGATAESHRLQGEVGLMIEEARQLGVPTDAFARRLELLRTEEATAPAEATRTGVQRLHEEIAAVLRPILEESLRALERDLDIARSAGVPLEKIGGPLAEARRRLALPVPAGAAALLDEVRTALVSSRGYVDHAERAGKRVHEALAQAELLRVELGGLAARTERFDGHLADREYARVVELAGPLERELRQATYQHVAKMLAGFQSTITQLRRDGANTSVAENLLHQSRMMLDEGRPIEAVQLAGRSENELERVDLQHRLAEGSLQVAEAAVAKARDESVVAVEADDLVRAARAAYAEHAYPDVFDRTIAIGEILAQARTGRRRALEAIEVAERQLAEARQLAIDVRDAAAQLAEAQGEVGLGRYVPAVRLAREATEAGRWAIERTFSGPIDELRRRLDAARAEGLSTELDAAAALVAGADAAARAHQWTEARGEIARAEDALRRMFEETLDGRWREIEAAARATGPVPPAEEARRSQVAEKLAALRTARDLGGGLKLLRDELERLKAQRRETIGRSVGALRDRLWIGERLGVDTTPAMQLFGEARVAADSGRLDEAGPLLEKAGAALREAVAGPLARRRKELATEINFAAEGLHVSVGPIPGELRTVDEKIAAGQLLEGAQELLRIEEALNLRKSLHRELTNLHYLIDAALGRAEERRLDTARARALLEESVRLRDSDYAAAIGKAREALQLLQREGVATAEPPPPAAPAASPFWPFRRPPTS